MLFGDSVLIALSNVFSWPGILIPLLGTALAMLASFLPGLGNASVAVIALMLSATPVLAQDSDVEEGSDLLQEGAKLLLRGLLSEIEPQLDDMAKALDEAAPQLQELMEVIGDIRNYHAPEVLPNGDILIRKKTPAEIAGEEPGEIEL